MAIRDDYSLLINKILAYLLVYGSTVNKILELSTVIVNLIHLIILFQKELRTTTIFILMIGICISDILAFTDLYFYIGEDRVLWYRSLLYTMRYSGFEMTLCLQPGYKSISLVGVAKVTVLNACRPISIWLAVIMALFRTLSIIFPMSNWVQGLGKPRITVLLMVMVCLFWIGYYSWEMIFLKLWWFPDHIYKKCFNPQKALKYTQYILVLDPDSIAFSRKRESWEYIIRLIPVVFYPFLTISLLIELWRIRKKRKVNSKANRDNTTFLILFMTISFMLSEGLTGITSCVEFGCINDLSVDIKDYSSSFSQIFVNLRSFNALSHFFVCIFMSSQYRGTVAKMVCFKKTLKVVKVTALQSTLYRIQSRTF